MITKISEGVQISVETFYQSDYSNPGNHEFMFAYRITIENHNSFSVKLDRRHWHIFDSNGEGLDGFPCSITLPIPPLCALYLRQNKN